MTGSVEETRVGGASGSRDVSSGGERDEQERETRKVADITQALSHVSIGKDAVSRIAQRLEEELSDWRIAAHSFASLPLLLEYPYLSRPA